MSWKRGRGWCQVEEVDELEEREGRLKEKSSYVGISVDREIERERDGEMLMR
jgi:hypothetical protein